MLEFKNQTSFKAEMRPARKAATKAALAIKTEAEDSNQVEDISNNDSNKKSKGHNAFAEIMSSRSRTMPAPTIASTAASTTATPTPKTRKKTTSTFTSPAVSSSSSAVISDHISDMEDLVTDAARVRLSNGKHSFKYHRFLGNESRKRVHDDILAWYDIYHRKLPWRRDFWTPKTLEPTEASENKTVTTTATTTTAASTPTLPAAAAAVAAEMEALSMQEYEKQHPGQRAYEVWVSEIMCQQTQVATVIPYYNTWMEKWPTIHDLAAADLEDVNKVWTGLGYYSRASRLHSGAQKVVKEFNGVLPRDPVVLEKEIPGIGRYTAGAIASHAYNVPAELVDGNVIRVLSRLRAIGGDVKSPKVIDLHWQIAKELVHQDRPGCFNQGLMELGAVICTPQNPQCGKCPVRTSCRAYAEMLDLKKNRQETIGASQKRQIEEEDGAIVGKDDSDECTLCLPAADVESKDQGIVTQYPRKAIKKAPRDEECAVSILERVRSLESGESISEFLLVKRPDKGLLAGMWEFPTVEQDQLQLDHGANNSSKSKDPSDTSILSTYKQRSESSHKYLIETLQQRWIEDHTDKEIQRRDLGSVQHLFSHIRKVYHVEWILIHMQTHVLVQSSDAEKSKGTKNIESSSKGRGNSGGKKSNNDSSPINVTTNLETAWLTAEELATAAIPTGINKTFQLLQKYKVSTNISDQVEDNSVTSHGSKRRKPTAGLDKNKKVKKEEVSLTSISRFFKAAPKS
ncbi:hypothetical protein BX616_010457 [Lobosporangium transversale]|nr:hypothetical protein BX616_010457 [Lobosporangium transversale]